MSSPIDKPIALHKSDKFRLSQNIVLTIGILCLLITTINTILLYSHYGPLTPNGNRYFHYFNMNTVDWLLVTIESLSMLSLVYPSLRYGLSCNYELHKMGIFPSNERIGGLVSIILTSLCIGSQIIYTISYSLIVNEYISNHSRVMAEDLEIGIQYFAYIGCILFWGFVNTVYSVKYRFKW